MKGVLRGDLVLVHWGHNLGFGIRVIKKEKDCK